MLAQLKHAFVDLYTANEYARSSKPFLAHLQMIK